MTRQGRSQTNLENEYLLAYGRRADYRSLSHGLVPLIWDSPHFYELLLTILDTVSKWIKQVILDENNCAMFFVISKMRVPHKNFSFPFSIVVIALSIWKT